MCGQIVISAHGGKKIFLLLIGYCFSVRFNVTGLTPNGSVQNQFDSSIWILRTIWMLDILIKWNWKVFKTSLVNQTVFLLNQFYFCFNRKSSLKTGSVLKPVRNRFRTCSIHNQFFKISLVSNWFSKTVQTFGFKNQTC